METRRKEINETRESKEAEMITGEVQSVDEAKEIFEQIMEKLDDNKEYAGSEGKKISFGSSASTS